MEGDDEKVLGHYSNISFFTYLILKPLDGTGGG